MSDNKNVAVSVENVTKNFKIPLEGSNGLKQKIVNQFKGRKGYREFTPLKGISFKVYEGDFFGIVGRNGSGKSTLLKTIAGIYSPQGGQIHVAGSLVPFIELGVGFNPELSGRENVYLNGALLGFSHKEVAAMYDDIVEFAELSEFMEERLKNYSSGMQVRLAFSIAIKAQGDILLLDEVLAVGDSAFQQKCFDYFEQLKKEKKTIIIVTHDMGAVQRFCNRAMIISNGVIEKIGKPDDIADVYKRENLEHEGKSEEAEKEKQVIKAKLLSEKVLKPTDSVKFEVRYKIPNDIDHYIGVSFLFNGQSAAERNSKDAPMPIKKNGWYSITFEQDLNSFNSGSYDISVATFHKDTERLIDYNLRASNFLIEGYDETLGGPMRLDGKWS
ncbi:MAG TPA: polysaccharide ABC transporter ATP-binding protein [Candidatus Microsaccharimonas sp.]|jgi:ABC-2 type transport system ATP-binding protein